MLRRLADLLRMCINILHYFMKMYQTQKEILVERSMDFRIKCVTVCLFDWLLFIFYYIYRLYAIAYVFNI